MESVTIDPEELELRCKRHWLEVMEQLAPRRSDHHAAILFAFEGVIDSITSETASKLRGDLYGARVRVGLCATSGTSWNKVFDPDASYADFVRGTWFQAFCDQPHGEEDQGRCHFYTIIGETATCIRCTGDKGDIARCLNMPTLLIDVCKACVDRVCSKGLPGSYGALATRTGSVVPFPPDNTRRTVQRKWMKVIREWLDLMEWCSQDAIDFFMPRGRHRLGTRQAQASAADERRNLSLLQASVREDPEAAVRRWLRDSAVQECPICMSAGRLDITTTCCGVSLHNPCWTNCVRINKHCPFCRRNTEVTGRDRPAPTPPNESSHNLITSSAVDRSTATPRLSSSERAYRRQWRNDPEPAGYRRNRRYAERTCDGANCYRDASGGWFGEGDWSQYYFCRSCWREYGTARA